MVHKEKHIESDRRVATVMFADIAGFTAMSEKMDPEEVTSLMNNCFSMMEDIIEKYDGTIDKFIGDCVMVLFGAPKAVENAPRKAINTAIELKNQLIEFNAEKDLSIPLDIHVGIHAGVLVAGMVGGKNKREYTVMGDTVNLASRIEAASQVGQILVSRNIYRETKDGYRYRALKPISLKGKAEPVPVYELLSINEKKYRPSINFSRTVHSEIVGRKKEIELLELKVNNLATGKGAIINIVGEAGIGKSRIIVELKDRRIIKHVSVFEGRSISIGRNLSFHPIIDLLRNWAKIKENDSEEEAFGKLESAVRQIHPEADEIIPFAAIIMGMKLPDRYNRRITGIEGEALEKLIIKNVRQLIVKGAEQMPMIILMEDLHWADNSSIELLESLFRLVETHPVLFVNMLRPGYKHTGGKITETINDKYPDYFTEILLNPLDENQSKQLINSLMNIHEMPDSLRTKILIRACGNPFFIEEVVRSLIDSGAVVKKHGKFEAIGKINHVVIPHTINELLMARLDRLDKETKNLVKVASVIGRNFLYRIIAEVAHSVKDLDQRLEYLKKVEFISEQKTMEELAFLFRHALAQETAYESILFQKKKELHIKIAQAIEKVFHEKMHEFYGMLAYHYSSGEDLDKAEEFMLKAGEESLKAGASSEALKYYKEALNIYLKKYGKVADPGKVAMMEKNIALTLYNKGRHYEATEYFERALSYYGIKDPTNKYLRLLKFLAGFSCFLLSVFFPILNWRKNPSARELEAINLHYKKAATLLNYNPVQFFIETFIFSRRLAKFDLTKIEGGPGMAVGSSVAFSWTGISFKLSRKILNFVKDKINKDDIRTLIYFELAELFPDYYTGNWQKEYHDDLVEQGLRYGEILHTSAYISFHGRIKIELGCFNEALAFAEKLADTGNTYEHDFPRALAYFLKTKLLMKFRKLNDALDEADKGISFVRKTDFRQILFVLHSFKSRTHFFMGDMGGTASALENAETIKNEVNIAPAYLSNYYISRCIFDLYRLEKAIYDNTGINIAILKKQALKSCKTSVKNSRKVSTDRTEALRLMGNYFRITGNRNKAMKWWKNSIKYGEGLGARLELARSCMNVGKCMFDMKSSDNNADTYLVQAESIFKELDLVWDMNELNKKASFR